jgi:hypothetical protein
VLMLGAHATRVPKATVVAAEGQRGIDLCQREIRTTRRFKA